MDDGPLVLALVGHTGVAALGDDVDDGPLVDCGPLVVAIEGHTGVAAL